MDPRRARDPRLARTGTDPRLQQPQPQQQPLRQQLPAPIPNNGINSNPGSHSITPPQPFVNAIATVSSQIPQAADASTSASMQPLDTHSLAGFKTRPLFCVVCASNQVGGFGTRACVASLKGVLLQNRSMEGHFVLQCACFDSISVRGVSDISKESWFPRYFVWHWVSCTITGSFHRQTQHLPFWYTIRRHLPGTPGERPSLVRPVLKW